MDYYKIDGVDIKPKLAFKKLDNDSSLAAKIICKWTNSDYYHVELIVGNYWISAMEGKGVTINKLLPLNEKWVYVDLPSVTLTSEQYTNVMFWIKQQENKKYDWLGIFYTHVFPLKFHNEDKWSCSEIVIKILQLLTYKKYYSLQANLLSPGDVAKLVELK